jgi:hypothetical protein
LDIFTRGYISEFAVVKFASRGEYDGFRRHVQTDGKGLRGEEDLDETFLEQDLDDLLEDGKQPTVHSANYIAFGMVAERKAYRAVWMIVSSQTTPR